MLSIRNQYAEMGVNQYYKTNANSYQNPHEKIIQSLIETSLTTVDYGNNVLDMCCGNGLVTKILNHHVKNIYGNDPFMKKQYVEQTRKKVLIMISHNYLKTQTYQKLTQLYAVLLYIYVKNHCYQTFCIISV